MFNFFKNVDDSAQTLIIYFGWAFAILLLLLAAHTITSLLFFWTPKNWALRLIFTLSFGAAISLAIYYFEPKVNKFGASKENKLAYAIALGILLAFVNYEFLRVTYWIIRIIIPPLGQMDDSLKFGAIFLSVLIVAAQYYVANNRKSLF
ncbi:MAG: hypothetical protein EZS28_001817 [Streblomastix strix]|uniref:Uncharacterized protein n=1 Tax=Streblomastix strix TaxID=222440 RepID=A0A5J4X7E4_9EUKA|nr:MAG: hypothetical protein EZS28_001817 [Streblomastix strix]